MQQQSCNDIQKGLPVVIVFNSAKVSNERNNKMK